MVMDRGVNKDTFRRPRTGSRVDYPDLTDLRVRPADHQALITMEVLTPMTVFPIVHRPHDLSGTCVYLTDRVTPTNPIVDIGWITESDLTRLDTRRRTVMDVVTSTARRARRIVTDRPTCEKRARSMVLMMGLPSIAATPTRDPRAPDPGLDRPMTTARVHVMVTPRTRIGERVPRDPLVGMSPAHGMTHGAQITCTLNLGPVMPPHAGAGPSMT